MRRAVANRLGLAGVGVVLAAAGGYVLARRYEWLVPGRAGGSLYPRELARWLHGHDWTWILAAAACVVIGLLAMRWLWLQQRNQYLGLLRPDPEPGGGRTRLQADALTDAVEGDVVELPGVRRVSALLGGRPDAPRLEIRVLAFSGADLPGLRDRILLEAVEPARAALDLVALPVLLSLRVTGRGRGHDVS